MKKYTALQRIQHLIDPKSSLLIIGADQKTYDPSGIITAMGYIHGMICVIIANDFQIKSGAYFPITIKKHLRAQTIALTNQIPIIYLVDSAGVYLPLQDQIFPDENDFGKIFYNSAKMSSQGIIQIAAVMGHCVAGGAYLPVLSDESLMVEKQSALFLAGAYLVKSAIGENTDNQSLGGATTHCAISGIIDHRCKDEVSCLEAIRKKINTITFHPQKHYTKIQSKAPSLDIHNTLEKLSKQKKIHHDVQLIIDSIVDQESFDGYKTLYGCTLICGYARIEGWPVGIIANQRKMVKNQKGALQMGGVIYPDAAKKATRFIMNCNQRMIPLLFLQDVNGFMVGSQAEKQGMLKEGAKMINVIANTIVPKFTVIIGNAYGAGYYAMCGRAFQPNLLLAWPTAKIGVMHGKTAANTLLNIKKNKLDEVEEKKLRNTIESLYQKKNNSQYAASQLWIDSIISPEETRHWISQGITAASYASIKKKFNPGLIQA